MAFGSTRSGLARVERLAKESVSEDIESRAGTVGQFVLSGSVQEPRAPGKGGVSILYVENIFIERSGSGPGGKDSSDDAARFEQTTLTLAQPSQLQIDHAQQAV